MIIVKKATNEDKLKALKLAKDLKDWFSLEGLKHMETDFKFNQVVVAKDQVGKVVGFLCYTAYSGRVLLLWMGVKLENQGQGIGSLLLNWLSNETKKLDYYAIEVETLPEEIKYAPYEKTRDFYYRHGFKRIAYRKASLPGWDDQIVLEKRVRDIF